MAPTGDATARSIPTRRSTRFQLPTPWKAALAAAVVASAAHAQDTQRVTPTPESQSKAGGAAVQIDVGYTTSNGDATLTGLGLRVHFDSTRLTYAAPANVLTSGLLGQQDPQADAANLDGDAATDRFVLVSWADIAGNWPGTVPVRLMTLNFTTSASFSGQTAVRFTAASTAAGYAFASTPATVTASGPSGPTLAEAGSQRAVIPSSAHAPGLLGTSWVSDAVLHNPGAASTTANLYFLPSGQDNSAVRGVTRSVPAGQSVRLDDVVSTTFGQSQATGAILVGANQPLLVSSRVFNNASSGTYGQYLPGFPTSDAVSGTTAVRLIQLTKNANYRTNIGFANATGSALPVEVRLYRADGSSLGTRSYTAPPWGQLQETDIIGKVTSGDVNDAYAVVSSSASGASYHVYASVVDNRSGDPVTIVPVPASAPAGATAAQTWPGAAGPTLPAEAAASTVTIMSDGFEGTFPGVWTVEKSSSASDALWGRSVQRAAAGSASAWCAAGGSIAGGAGGPYRPQMDTWMIYGPFSLADATAASAEFDLWLQSESGYDYVWWLVSVDNESFSGYRVSGATNGWEHVVFDFADVASFNVIGQPQVWFAFNFESDFSREYEGAYVDNVVLRKTTATCTTPPAPVVTAPATATSGTSYTVTWTATSSDNTYELEEATNPSFTGPTGLTVTGTSFTTSHTVASPTTYYYRVRARIACGGSPAYSPYSNTAQTTVSAACAAPTAPALSAPATATSGASYTVSWTATSPDTSYDIQEAGDPSFAGASSVRVNGTSRTFSHTVSAPTTYYYRVWARDDCGGSTYFSPWSNVGQTTVTASCANPAAPTLTAPAAAASGSTYTVSWTATSPDASYDVEEASNPSFSGASSFRVSGTSRSFSHTVTSPATYYYRVAARDECGGSTYVSPWSTTAQTAVAPAATGESVYVPGGAALSGLGGTNWKTDLEVHNPGTARADFVVALLRRDQENANPQTRSFSLEGGRSARYENALQSIFAASGAATLRVTPTSGTVMVTSRTYNDHPQGTYGQFAAGVPAGRAIAAGTSARLIQLSRSADAASGFRSNLGLVNTTGSTVVVEATFYSGVGAQLGTRSYTLRPYESIQRTDVLSEVGASTLADAYVVVRTATSGGRFLAYASVIDNRSGDPIYIPAR